MTDLFSFAGFDQLSRRVFVGHFPSFEQLREASLPIDGRFVLFLASDASNVSHDELAATAEAMLARGAVYVMAWGEDCERVEAFFDEAIEGHGLDPEGPTIITTSHPRESIEVALAFASYFAVPGEGNECNAMLLAFVDDSAASHAAEEALKELLHEVPPVDDRNG